MYARRKGWPLTHVRVDVTHGKMHGRDTRAPNGKRIDCFSRTIALEGALDTGQKQRLLEIADKCPVHRTLEAGAQVVTRLADAKIG